MGLEEVVRYEPVLGHWWRVNAHDGRVVTRHRGHGGGPREDDCGGDTVEPETAERARSAVEEAGSLVLLGVK